MSDPPPPPPPSDAPPPPPPDGEDTEKKTEAAPPPPGGFSGCEWAPPPPPEYEYPSETESAGQLISEEDIHEILEDHISGTAGVCCDVFCCRRVTCCWSKGPLKNMTLKPVDPSFAFTSKLVDFTEGRHTEHRMCAFHGGYVDDSGAVPMWSVNVGTYSRTPFEEGKKAVTLPGSENVITCSCCHGCGHVTCYHCHGWGHVNCSACHGSGTSDSQVQSCCNACCGSGKECCPHCHGSGEERCGTCDGTGKCKTWLDLVVNWRNVHHLETVQKSNKGSGVPEVLLAEARGAPLVNVEKETGYIHPATHFVDDRINQASSKVFQMGEASREARGLIGLHQRHTIEKIAMSECEADFGNGGEPMLFYVYGELDRLYFEDAGQYPTNCCYCCHRNISTDVNKRLEDNAGLNELKKRHVLSKTAVQGNIGAPPSPPPMEPPPPPTGPSDDPANVGVDVAMINQEVYEQV